MARVALNSAFWDGCRQSSPFLLIVAPFGALFGVVATEAGLSVFETMAFTTTVFAGAAQLTAIQVMKDSAPTLIVLLSALAVNLRMAMYSATLTPYFRGTKLWQRACIAYFMVDQSFALSSVRFEEQPDLTVNERMGFFFGTCALVVPTWYMATLAGAVMGSQIPENWALDFALPITFLAMIAPSLRTLAHVAAAFVAVLIALLAAGLPFNFGLIIGGLAGMITGAQVEQVLKDRGTWIDR